MRSLVNMLIAAVSLLLAGACFALLCLGRRSASFAHPVATCAAGLGTSARRAGACPPLSMRPAR